MNPRFHAAIGEAMSRLRTADVAGATAALQRALSGEAPEGRRRAEDSRASSVGFKAPLPRRLGDVLRTLSNERGQFKHPAAETKRGPDASDDDERFCQRSFQAAAGSVTYKLYIPAGHAERELALVMMLHGCTQDPDDFARGTRMNALADEFGLIVAYPHQPRSANAQGCWHWFDTRHQRRGSGEPAVLAGLALELAADFKIDRKRIFVAGLSAGGAMADVLSATYPDVFSAAGIHSGLPHGIASDVMSAFAAMKGTSKGVHPTRETDGRKIIFHGDADVTVNPSNGKMVFDRAQSRHGKLPEVLTDGMVNGRRVTRMVRGPATGPATAEYWIVHGSGHAWSGGDNRGSFADATGPDASREMIRFFLQS
ncbi:poly(hydroxyalkanoate) depolymerase family esterase [Bosea sp. BE125]|uniref:extracellular catalytic domain type 1 short-chain-length polyhydroxyalkanoate depolymerase n=1 Tax=Bosea sp. BE125 TaxID=2817909 RepID=UPI00285D3390|nr:PHB depolymerase family esterase [Bosea sp. BE125]MDR6872225.1 poly(hydroxyalkanoate) depolymerase family esterase [Bosea sp. BE125]